MADTNATEAPTSAATEDALANRTAGLNQDEIDFVSLMHQYYGISGKLMTVRTAVDEYFFEENEFNNFFGDPLVQKALQERNVLHRRSEKESKRAGNIKVTNNWKDTALDPLQLLVANTMLDLVDNRSQKKKLQDLGVSTTKYADWLNDPAFSGYLRERAESMLGSSQHEAHLALLDKVRMGDMKAIEYVNEMTGRFTKASANGGGGNTSSAEFKGILVHILEIINDEINDPEISLRIADKFKGLINAQTVAGQLLAAEEPIEQPHIAGTRELSPRLQTLMNKGEGYE